MENRRKLEMKRLNYFLTIVLILFAGNVLAQNDPKAKSILADVSKKFRSYNVVKADFTYTFTNRQANETQSQSGTLWVQSKFNKYKVNLPGQEIVSDGKNQWTYLKEDNEVQIAEIDNSPDALNPAQIFTIYEKGFKYVYIGDSKLNGKVVHQIELAPLASRSFSKIKLLIDKASKTISSFAVYDKNGNIYSYLIKTFIPNVNVSASTFAFDQKKYPGVEVVDLR
ncbi:outer membrane lipoprotein carrier protein LolA [Pseudopedobacter saltans DSM 12145]|uniref:Outer membrane lipoprotein carrier protein LolA n=1 Tax=Pseudopedobacter saltans (strain ATCC 51119 / DSM 12145 / JCM 21818 / CCUG 39354 / LMG 10337 / NBRC 100064 / NCIMB 13643) TaxID=762903 RepID=F0S9S4_PSESL|nr:outer membrane lipoprotein carrier protein LolA [Pseudopedobacter saltans]ADY51430.1 outer membrane lipoprotein carrier protein LolA [Pseudopedobacter saltans DSM 12145]